MHIKYFLIFFLFSAGCTMTESSDNPIVYKKNTPQYDTVAPINGIYLLRPNVNDTTKKHNEIKGELRVTMRDDGLFYFELFCMDSYYKQASLSAELPMENEQIVYENNDFGSCKVVLSFMGDSVLVEQTGDGFECGFGANMTVTGVYKRGAAKQKHR